MTCVLATPIACADPETEAVSADAPAPHAPPPPPEGAPVDDGRVGSSPPKTTKSPHVWTLTVWGKDETSLRS